jgi:hypothetical protein
VDRLAGPAAGMAWRLLQRARDLAYIQAEGKQGVVG